MSDKFTKGEWLIVETDDFVENVITTTKRMEDSLLPICGIDTLFDGGHGVEQVANAYLMKAAPKMYRMLDTLCNRYPNSPHIQDPIIKLLAEARGEKT